MNAKQIYKNQSGSKPHNIDIEMYGNHYDVRISVVKLDGYEPNDYGYSETFEKLKKGSSHAIVTVTDPDYLQFLEETTEKYYAEKGGEQ